MSNSDKQTIKTIAFLIGLIWLAAPYANANPALDFAKQLKGKFPSEVKDSQFNKVFLVRAHYPDYSVRATYDDASQTTTMTMSYIGDIELIDDCKVVGTKVGQNGYGAIGRFKKEVCHRLFLETSQKPSAPVKSEYSYDISFPSTPGDYRNLVKNGADLAIEFSPIKNTSELVKYDYAFHEARIDNPSQVSVNLYRLPARVKKVTFFLRKSKVPFHTDEYPQW